MPRFFLSADHICGDTVTITGEDALHISRSLRMRSGEKITVCDMQKNEYECELVSFTADTVSARILEARKNETEPVYRAILYQALPKAGKMEVIVQKCVELGVTDIVPVETARCVVRQERDFEKKRLRYQRVAYEAAKQSRRGIVPAVHKTVKLKNCDFSCCDAVLFAYEEEQEVTLKQALKTVKRGDTVGLIVGPEGGFSPEEASWLRGRVAGTVTLGKRILRTETAGMAMLAMALYELEE